MNAKQLLGSAIGTAVKIVVVIVAVMLIYKYSKMGYEYGYRVFAEEPVSTSGGRTVTVAVDEGDSAGDIGVMLEEKGLIRDGLLFRIQELLSEYHGELKPGIYDLSTAMTAGEMMEIMSAEKEEEPLPETDEGEELEETAGEDGGGNMTDGEAEEDNGESAGMGNSGAQEDDAQ